MKGFTLIELLIVVAIIGILAAIAVPHFLSAQIRARVAQVKAELVGLVVALESYAVDHDMEYPIARTYCHGAPEGQINSYYKLPHELTTPLAYLSTLFHDPFNQHPHETYKYIKPGFGYFNEMQTVLGIQIQPEFPEDRGQVPRYYYDPKTAPVGWAVWSVGPRHAVGFWEAGLRHHPVPQRTWYDPTNGIVSDGVITRLATGQMSPG